MSMRTPSRPPIDAYAVRMARINISVPDDLATEAKAAGINISEVTRRALAHELRRQALDEEWDDYIAEVEAEFGPGTPEEIARSEAWAERVFGPPVR